jgi:hypothetical protein
MRLIDLNILIYAMDQTSSRHQAAKDWLDDTLSGAETVALAWNVLIGFVFASPSTVKPCRHLSFLALGWFGIAVTLLLPLLWLPGQGSMFRSFKKAAASDEPEKRSNVVYNEVLVAPSQIQGPTPNFVYLAPQMQQQMPVYVRHM